jgi:hypothetical protein
MLIAAFICAISLGVMFQFLALTWRAGLVSIAAQQAVPGIELKIKDFRDVSAYERLSPDLGFGPVPKMLAVKSYYRALEFLSGGETAGWAGREMALCTRYATVVISHRLASNQALAAEMRSY